VNDPDE